MLGNSGRFLFHGVKLRKDSKMNIPKITIYYAGVLILLGLIGYFGFGRVSITALIPAFFGVVVLIVGLVGRKESMRKHAMHAASVLGFMGFVSTAGGLGGLYTLLTGGEVARPAATVSRSIWRCCRWDLLLCV